jgi:hypothetical protein
MGTDSAPLHVSKVDCASLLAERTDSVQLLFLPSREFAVKRLHSPHDGRLAFDVDQALGVAFCLLMEEYET